MGKMKRFVAIAGNVGVGKSTLTGLLAQRLAWEPFFEAVDENPYLSDFYADMRTWSFHSQIYFLSRRLRHHRQLLAHPKSVVQDRSVYEDAEVFARNLYVQGHMDERDYRSYRELYEVLTSFLPPPDLYLAQLNELYDQWIDDFQLCPILTLPADELDFVANDDHLDLIAAKTLEKLQGREEVVLAQRNPNRFRVH
jgi:deoxyadenosine/deoxycytidine kinase